MTFKALTAGTIVALLITSAAQAATITHRSGQPTKVLVIEGAERQEKILSPGQVLDGVCQQGCIIRLNDSSSSEYELKSSESVSVEEGFLYYDDVKSAGAPGNGSISR
jgi:hypothetical protein